MENLELCEMDGTELDDLAEPRIYKPWVQVLVDQSTREELVEQNS